MKYNPEEDFILDSKSGDFAQALVTVKPELTGYKLKEPVKIIVTISGRLCDSDKIFEQTIPFVVTL